MGIAWADNLSVGNGLIDSDHKNLIVAVNNVANAIETRDRTSLPKTFRLLVVLLRIHFINEEKIARAANFPIESIRLGHLQWTNEISYLIEKLLNIHSAWPDHLVIASSRFLKDRMISHIVEEDMQLKPVLETFSYDFVSN